MSSTHTEDVTEIGPEGGSSPLLPTSTCSEPVLPLSRDLEDEDPDVEPQPDTAQADLSDTESESDKDERSELEPSPEEDSQHGSSHSGPCPWQQVHALQGMLCTRDIQLQDMNRLFECAMDENRRLQDHIIRLRTFMAQQLGGSFLRPPSPLRLVDPVAMDLPYYQERTWLEELSPEYYPDQTVQDINSESHLDLEEMFGERDVEFVNMPGMSDEDFYPELSGSDSQFSHSSLSDGGDQDTRAVEREFRREATPAPPPRWPRAHSHSVCSTSGRSSRAREERRQRKMALAATTTGNQQHRVSSESSMGRSGGKDPPGKSDTAVSSSVNQQEVIETDVTDPRHEANTKCPATAHPEAQDGDRPATATLRDPVFRFRVVPSIEEDVSIDHEDERKA